MLHPTPYKLHAPCFSRVHDTCYMLHRVNTNYMQHATRDMLHATPNTQHATCNIQHATRSTQHATCIVQHASCIILHTTCYMLHPMLHNMPRYMLHNMLPEIRYTLHATCYKLQCSSSLCAFQVSMSNHFVWLPIEEKGDATLVITFACPTLSLPVPASSITALI